MLMNTKTIFALTMALTPYVSYAGDHFAGKIRADLGGTIITLLHTENSTCFVQDAVPLPKVEQKGKQPYIELLYKISDKVIPSGWYAPGLRPLLGKDTVEFFLSDVIFSDECIQVVLPCFHSLLPLGSAPIAEFNKDLSKSSTINVRACHDDYVIKPKKKK